MVEDASNLAPNGTLHIGNDPTTYDYVRASINNNILKLSQPLASDMPAGTVIVANARQVPGPVQFDDRSTAQGGGCAMATGERSTMPATLLGLALALAACRKRRRRGLRRRLEARDLGTRRLN